MCKKYSHLFALVKCWSDLTDLWERGDDAEIMKKYIINNKIKVFSRFFLELWQ